LISLYVQLIYLQQLVVDLENPLVAVTDLPTVSGNPGIDLGGHVYSVVIDS
jgi:hypothetical protein